MNYFTPELYQQFNSFDVDAAERADEAWDRAELAYKERLATIRERLPFFFQPYPLTLLGARSRTAVSASPSAELLTLMKQAQPADAPGIRRDEPFLRWRLANPQRRYEFVTQDRAYAVFARMDGFLFIIDFWEANKRAGLPIVATLRDIANTGRMKGLLTWGSARSDFADRLRRHLFLTNPFGRGPASLRTPLISYGTEPFDPDCPWAVAPLDHDSQ